MSQLDLDAIRLDLEEIEQRWTDPEENMYGLLSAAGKLVEHNRALLAEVERVRAIQAVTPKEQP